MARVLRAFGKPRVVGAGVVGRLIASLTLFRGTLLFQYGLGYTLEPVLVALLIPVVILAASGTGWMARILNARGPVLIGQISYGMYLFHPVLMDPPRHFFLRFTPGATPLAVIFSISVVIVVRTFRSGFLNNRCGSGCGAVEQRRRKLQ